MATRAQIQKELEDSISTVVGRIMSGLVTTLADDTPKDTGYHATRWVGSVGTRPASRTTPNSRSGRAESLSLGQQQASIATLIRYRYPQVAFVSNDGDFIEQLNAREGNFVERDVINAVRTVSLAGTSLRR